MNPEPQTQHLWLHKLLGEWRYESEVLMGSEQPPARATGVETVRSLGNLWIQCESQGEMPGCGTATNLMTLGYDPQKQRYVGTWIGSMMTYLWLYDGELDADQRVLTLNSEGPDMSGADKIAQYRDIIEFKSDNHRIMTSHALGDNGQWHQFMTANYLRQS
jgi:hypothetical protein